MIHINVADTQTLVEKSDGVTKYTAYNIYVNGSFHAAVRFSRLIQFAEAIKQRFATKKHLMLRFPSKQWFPLDEKGIEQRRIKISNYFNLLAQSPDIVRSLFVERRFLEFQIESYPETSSNISLNVFLGDGYKIGIKCALSLCTDDVMKKIAKQLQIDNSERFLQMFGLFLARPRDDSSNHVDGQFNMLVVRLLRNFESPYATLQTANRQSAIHGVCYKLVIRKMIWDPRVEQTLLGDAVFVDLLYRQAKSDLQNGFFSISSESIAEDLRILEADDDKLQYLRICHQFPSYSYEVFPHCISDYPEPDTSCEVMIGRRQLVLVSSKKEPKQHYAFRATRIHLWKICDRTSFAGQGPLIFQFEYLVDKSSFKWITLCTDHAILISMLIHSIGAEILRERSVLKGSGGHALQVKSCSGHSKGLVTAANRSDSNSATIEAEIHHSKASTYETSSTWKVVNQKSLIRVVRTGIVALVSNDRLNTSGGSNPLGICQHSDLFTTITDTLPLNEEVSDILTDDDL